MEIRIYWTIQILHLTLQVSEIHSMIETENFSEFQKVLMIPS